MDSEYKPTWREYLHLADVEHMHGISSDGMLAPNGASLDDKVPDSVLEEQRLMAETVSYAQYERDNEYRNHEYLNEKEGMRMGDYVWREAFQGEESSSGWRLEVPEMGA